MSVCVSVCVHLIVSVCTCVCVYIVSVCVCVGVGVCGHMATCMYCVCSMCCYNGGRGVANLNCRVFY